MYLQSSDRFCNDVILLVSSDVFRHVSIEINPWNDTVGHFVDVNSINHFGKEKFAALVLYEMTWFGYSSETIQKKVESW